MFYEHYDPKKHYRLWYIYFPKKRSLQDNIRDISKFNAKDKINIKDLSKLHFKGNTPVQHTSDISSYNVGNSDYHTHRYQPWDVWQDYQLDPWDADIAKRIMRHKKGDPISLDYEKIKHVCDKQLQRIELGQKQYRPASHEENAYDRFEDYHFDKWDAEILDIILRNGAYYSLPPCYERIKVLCDQQLGRIKLGLKK